MNALRWAVTFAVLAVPLLTRPDVAAAQESSRPVYLVVDYMKPAPGRAADYVRAEQEVFLPIHQKHVDAGHKLRWLLYQVQLPGSMAHDYDYVTVNLYNDLRKLETNEGILEAFQEVFPGKEVATVVNPVLDTRQIVRREIWRLTDTAAPLGAPAKYALVGYMKTRSGQNAIAVEQENWKPLHTERVKAGAIKNWGLYTLLVQGSATYPYDYAAINFFDDYSYFENAYPAEVVQRVVQDPEAMIARTEAAREYVKNELWSLVTSTE